LSYGLRATENPDTNVYDASGNIVDPNATTTYGTTYTGQAMGPAVPFLTSPVSWLNANSTMVMLGVGVLGLILLLGKGRR
jgi:lysozyme family protein